MLESVIRRFTRRSMNTIDTVRRDSLTYLDRSALVDLHEAARHCERKKIGGLFVEAGCALGGSAIVLAAAKAQERPLHVYDVFGMIPPPSAMDGPDVYERYAAIRAGRSQGIGGNTYYGYETNLLEKVRNNFSRLGFDTRAYNVHLIQGLFQDTIHIAQPVALAHVDGDWYDSVMTCVSRLAPALALGGVLIIDDYDSWSGCRKAIDEYFADKRDNYVFRQRARLQIVRRG